MTPVRADLSLQELLAILDRAASGPLSAPDAQRLRAAIDTLAWLTGELERKDTTVARLRQYLFGTKTESTSRVVGAAAEPAGAGKGSRKAARRRHKGHGRHGAAAYLGAERVHVTHTALAPGVGCPGCERGKLYAQSRPAQLLRIQGIGPLRATVWELDRLRCNLCGEVFTAEAPPKVGAEKYDATAASMIGLLKYGCGLPFNRLERLENSLGIPLPAASQWEVVQKAAGWLAPAYVELVRQAAQGEVLYNDDTTMKILGLSTPSDHEPQEPQDEQEPTRTGVFTSGIVSTSQGEKIALFFTGRQHAGENLAQVLAQRAAELAAPIQMCDALSRNSPDALDTVLAHCIAHARRRFVEVAASFPEDCRHVLETLGEVYHNDKVARQQELSAEERLRLHQEKSGPLLEQLKRRFVDQLAEHMVEPNSGLGEAIGYTLKHWDRLTMFLRVAGAPLDNNVCEQALKKAILHRKNSLFYKTQNDARVGDIFMSLIYTAELRKVNPFDYLVALQKYGEAVSADPAAWMPWNYTLARGRLTAGVSSAG